VSRFRAGKSPDEVDDDMKHSDNMPDRTEAELSDDERRDRLVMHLGEIVQKGGAVQERWGLSAVVLRKTRESITPNVLMMTIGLVLFGITLEPMFALAVVLAALGWHKKILQAASPRKMLVKVDEMGRVNETVLDH
jgi:hypothetical protein